MKLTSANIVLYGSYCCRGNPPRLVQKRPRFIPVDYANQSGQRMGVSIIDGGVPPRTPRFSTQHLNVYATGL